MRLDSWLKQATRRLSMDAIARVRAEISEHYESARENAIRDGATPEEAARIALTALGDPKAANCQYRKVLLTSAEARLLASGNTESRLFCSRPGLKRMLLAAPVIALLASAACFLAGGGGIARVLLAAGTLMAVVFAVPQFPIYTPIRSRVYRFVKCLVLVGTFALALWPEGMKSSWLFFSCVWPLVWVEWTRVSIRRKLPVAQWPRQLYL